MGGVGARGDTSDIEDHRAYQEEMTMKIQKLLLPAIGAVALGGISTPARSDTQPAIAGHSIPNFDPCFTIGTPSQPAVVTNTCAGPGGSTRRFIIPLQTVNTLMPYSVAASFSGNGVDGGTTCQAISAGSNGSSIDFSSSKSSTTSSTPVLLDLGSVSVPLTGMLYFDCKVAEGGGRVFEVAGTPLSP
jgi:hypothetical protein